MPSEFASILFCLCRVATLEAGLRQKEQKLGQLHEQMDTLQACVLLIRRLM